MRRRSWRLSMKSQRSRVVYCALSKRMHRREIERRKRQRRERVQRSDLAPEAGREIQVTSAAFAFGQAELRIRKARESRRADVERARWKSKGASTEDDKDLVMLVVVGEANIGDSGMKGALDAG